MHESPRRSNHLQRRLPKGEDRLKSAKHQGTNQPKRCGTEFNRQPQKRLRCVHNLGSTLSTSASRCSATFFATLGDKAQMPTSLLPDVSASASLSLFHATTSRSNAG